MKPSMLTMLLQGSKDKEETKDNKADKVQIKQMLGKQPIEEKLFEPSSSDSEDGGIFGKKKKTSIQKPRKTVDLLGELNTLKQSKQQPA